MYLYDIYRYIENIGPQAKTRLLILVTQICVLTYSPWIKTVVADLQSQCVVKVFEQNRRVLLPFPVLLCQFNGAPWKAITASQSQCERIF